jgi:hypothetical protein
MRENRPNTRINQQNQTEVNNMSEPVLTIVEELKGLKLSKFDNMYDPNFWLPYIPLTQKSIERIGEKQYRFDVADKIALDPLGALVKDFRATGTLEVIDRGNQGDKGQLWEMKFTVTNPEVIVETRVRAKDVPNALKVGIYITRLDFDAGLMQGFGRDAIYFAARVKIRELLQSVQKKMS